MTTIAYKDGVLAVDTAGFSDVYRGQVRKLFCVPGVGAFALSGGCLGMASQIDDWLRSFEESAEPPALPERSAVVLCVHNRVYRLEEGRQLVPLRDVAFAASGSGEAVALGAMAAGATAEEAVEISSQFDPWTRGPFQSLHFPWDHSIPRTWHAP
jgi:hypothetical protein